MLDLNSGAGPLRPRLTPETAGERINAAIDAACLARFAAQPPRDYLGASIVGDPCARKVQFTYQRAPRERADGRVIDPRLVRIFDAGHTFEEMAARWLREAGFILRTTDRNGQQFGFTTAGGRIRGHIDGVIVGGPEVGIAWPVGWEHKALNNKSWQDTLKRGVELSKPVYFGQMQIYMSYLDLPAFIFTATNKDTEELWHEPVSFNPAKAQALSDRAVEILRACDADELLPRVAASSDFYLCRMCDFAQRCWSMPT